jgi:hypothetical protein
MMTLAQIADVSTNTLRLNQDLRVSPFGNERIVTLSPTCLNIVLNVLLASVLV